MINIIFLTRAGTRNLSFICSRCYVFTQALDARVTNSTNALVPDATLRTEFLLTNGGCEGLLLLAFSASGFESGMKLGSLSDVRVLCCQAAVSVSV